MSKTKKTETETGSGSGDPVPSSWREPHDFTFGWSRSGSGKIIERHSVPSKKAIEDLVVLAQTPCEKLQFTTTKRVDSEIQKLHKEIEKLRQMKLKIEKASRGRCKHAEWEYYTHAGDWVHSGRRCKKCGLQQYDFDEEYVETK